MYSPSHFAETRNDVLHGLMRDCPLAMLVTCSVRGVEADLLPLLLRPELGEFGELHGHVARANSLWRDHPEDVDVLAVFQGPQAYVSPNWYPTKREHGKAVPTWNYITVQARGRLQIVDEPTWKRDLLDTLTATHESSQASPWQISEAPPDYIEKMLNAIVGIRLVITELNGKWKVSQNQPAANRAGVIEALSAVATDNTRDMAKAIASFAPEAKP
jgi:transcriptional regulator